MSTTTRRTAQQIAADAQRAYRATVAKWRQRAITRGEAASRRASAYVDKAAAEQRAADCFDIEAIEYAAELARIDAALAALTGESKAVQA